MEIVCVRIKEGQHAKRKEVVKPSSDGATGCVEETRPPEQYELRVPRSMSCNLINLLMIISY